MERFHKLLYMLKILYQSMYQRFKKNGNGQLVLGDVGVEDLGGGFGWVVGMIDLIVTSIH